MSQTNFPHATDTEWATARRIIYLAAVRAGYDDATAEDMAQNAMVTIRSRKYRNLSPISPRVAVAWIVRRCRRVGWRDLLDLERARRMRPEWSEHETAAELATMAIHRRRSATLSPLDAVALAERHGIQWATDQILAAQGAGTDAEVTAEVAERMAG